MNEFIILKIVHCLHCSSLNILGIEETVVNVILQYNCDDYFSLFDLAYIKFKQNKIKEGIETLNEAKKKCKDSIYVSLLNKFQNFFDGGKSRKNSNKSINNINVNVGGGNKEDKNINNDKNDNNKNNEEDQK